MQHLRKNWYNYSVIKSKIDLLDRYIILNEILYRFVCLIKLTLFFALFTNMHVKVHQKFGLKHLCNSDLFDHNSTLLPHWWWTDTLAVREQNINHELFRHLWTATEHQSWSVQTSMNSSSFQIPKQL